MDGSSPCPLSISLLSKEQILKKKKGKEKKREKLFLTLGPVTETQVPTLRDSPIRAELPALARLQTEQNTELLLWK